MNISELTYEQKCHLAWRLDNKTSCGLLTACALARGDFGDISIVDAFIKYGSKSMNSAKIHAGKVINYSLNSINKRV
jgi:hypothetical protein